MLVQGEAQTDLVHSLTLEERRHPLHKAGEVPALDAVEALEVLVGNGAGPPNAFARRVVLLVWQFLGISRLVPL